MINKTIARITVRGLFGRRRFLLLLPLPVLLVVLAALADALAPNVTSWGEGVLVGLGVAVVLPVMALIVGTGVLGSEIDDGTLVHVLAKPLPRSAIVLTKLVVATAVTAVVVGVPIFVAGVLADSVRLGLALAVGSAVGALAYSALFLALSLVNRRPVLIGLLYVMIFEGLLSNVVSGPRVISVQKYVVAIADGIAGSHLLTGELSAPVAVALAAVLTVVCTWLAISRLRSFTLAGET